MAQSAHFWAEWEAGQVIMVTEQYQQKKKNPIFNTFGDHSSFLAIDILFLSGPPAWPSLHACPALPSPAPRSFRPVPKKEKGPGIL